MRRSSAIRARRRSATTSRQRLRFLDRRGHDDRRLVPRLRRRRVRRSRRHALRLRARQGLRAQQRRLRRHRRLDQPRRLRGLQRRRRRLQRNDRRLRVRCDDLLHGRGRRRLRHAGGVVRRMLAALRLRLEDERLRRRSGGHQSGRGGGLRRLGHGRELQHAVRRRRPGHRRELVHRVLPGQRRRQLRRRDVDRGIALRLDALLGDDGRDGLRRRCLRHQSGRAGSVRRQGHRRGLRRPRRHRRSVRARNVHRVQR